MKRWFFDDMKSMTTLGFSVVLALSMAVVFFILFQLDRWNSQSFALIMEASKEAEYTHIMRDAVRKRELSIQRILNADDAFERDEEHLHFLQYGAEFADARAKMQLIHMTPETAEQYGRVQQAIAYAQPYHDHLIEELIYGDLSEQELEMIVSEGSRAQETIVRLIDELVSLQRQRYKQVVDEYNSRRNTVLIITVVIFFFSIVFAIFVVRISIRQFRYVSRLSVIDEVSGTYNRRYFDMILEEEWKRSMRDHTALSLIMVDIDFFKSYNDEFGHQMGDVCLFTVAKILAGQLKRAADFIARYGGEEFVIVLPNTNAVNASFLAERLRSAVEESKIDAANTEVSKWLTVSIGVATTIAGFNQPSDVLVEAADQCLYESKNAGRNRVTEINLAAS